MVMCARTGRPIGGVEGASHVEPEVREVASQADRHTSSAMLAQGPRAAAASHRCTDSCGVVAALQAPRTKMGRAVEAPL